MTETLKPTLQLGAQRYLDGEISYDEFTQGLVLAIAESPDGPDKQEDFNWLAFRLING